MHPRLLKGINVENDYNIWYYHQRNAWQDSRTFVQLLKKINRMAVNENHIYYLLVDSVGAHIKGAHDIGCVGTVDDEMSI